MKVSPRSHSLRLLLASAAALAASLLPAAALADDADKAACEGKEEGDACTRGDGGEGTCSIDEDDDVLSCDDDAGTGTGSSSDDPADDGGCSVGAAPGAAGSGAWLAAGLALALHGRRRRRG